MKKWFKYFLIILIIVTFVPIIEVEKFNETNGTTLIDYRSLGSYALEHLEKMYLQHKEKKIAEDSGKNGNESPSDKTGEN